MSLALRIAATGDTPAESGQMFLHGAVLVKGGRVIATAPNIRKNSPFIFENQFDTRDEILENIRKHASVHAEERVIRMAGSEAQGAIVYVARKSPAGHPLLSKPCEKCHEAMVAAGVKAVVYSDSPQAYEVAAAA